MASTDSRLGTHIQLVALALVVAAVLALGFVLNNQQRESLLVEMDAEMDMRIRLNNAHLQQAIDTLRQDALFLSRTPPTLGIVRATLNGGIDPRDNNTLATWESRLQEIFVAFSQAHPAYFQIRYIGVADAGRELVSVKRQSGQVVTVPAAELQPKGDRDFVRETLRLKSGEIFLSEFDLYQDHGKIKVPHIATLRAATPVFTPEGKVFGLVVINMDANALLNMGNAKLPFSAPIYVANQDGYYLAHPDAARTYGFQSGHDTRMTQDFPALARAFDPVQPLRQPLHPFKTPTGVQYATTQRLHFDPRLPMRFLVTANMLPESVIAAELAPRRHVVLLGGVLVALLLGVLAVFLLQRLLAPLRAISAAARTIAEGKRQVALPENARGEVAILAVAFRAMLAEIFHREEELQRLNAKLESQVMASTAELRIAASVFENTSEGVMIVNEGGLIVSVNPAFSEITGYSAEEAIGSSSGLLKSHRHDAAFYAEMWRQLRGNNRWQGEIWNLRKNGELYLERLSINRIAAVDGFPVLYAGVFHDITEQRQADEQIRHLAFHDTLTNLPNRALFQDRLSHALTRASREGMRLSVIFIDLDGFKAVNDRLGHDVGDLLLQEVALRIQARLRRSMDTVARLGGDEFVVLMEDLAEAEHCASLAKEIIAAISQPLTLNGQVVQVGASLGIALFPKDGHDARELMKRADIAMYAAKAAGKGVYQFFQTDMQEKGAGGRS